MRIEPKNRKRLVDAAMGRIPCDLVIQNAQVVNVFTGEVYKRMLESMRDSLHMCSASGSYSYWVGRAAAERERIL